MIAPRDDAPPPAGWEAALIALLQNRNLNAYILIIFGGAAFALKMPETIYGGMILGGLAVLKSGG